MAVVHAVAAALDARHRGLDTGIIPTYDALLVEFDCRQPPTTPSNACRTPARQPAVLAPQRARQFDIPVVYGGDFGPDLDEVADHLELSPAE